MVRVLHELGNLDGGGVAKLLYEYYLHMDHHQIQFDFLVYDYYEEGIYERPLREMGCKIYKISPLKGHVSETLTEMENIFRGHSYDVFHSHRCSRGAIALRMAKKYGVPRRYVHSHIAYEDVSEKAKWVNRVLMKLSRHYATGLFACGRDAARYAWGIRAVQKGKVRIMTNAVDTDQFRFSPEMRVEKRRELNAGSQLVVGMVGRMTRQKNQEFLLQTFQALLAGGTDALLVFAGRGEDEEKIKKQAQKMGLEDQIRFLGVRNDIPDLLNAFDIFVLPSLYEGLPVVLVETQANGLPAVISDRITTEMNVTDLNTVVALDAGAERWAQEIAARRSGSLRRDEYAGQVAAQGYDIREESKKLQKFYING